MKRVCFVLLALLSGSASSALAQSSEKRTTAVMSAPEPAANLERGIQHDIIDYLQGVLFDGSLGFVDVAPAASLAAGIVDIYPSVRTQLSANGDTSGFVMAELSHGSTYIHQIVMVGANPFHSAAAPVFGGGLGGVVALGPRIDLNIDGLLRLTLRNLDQGTYDLLPGFRMTAAIAITPNVAITVGASYTVQVTNDPYTPDYGDMLGFVHLAWDGSKTVRSYVSFSLGVRFF